MSTPSGFCDGTSMMIVFARISRASRIVRARARRSASTIGVVNPPDFGRVNGRRHEDDVLALVDAASVARSAACRRGSIELALDLPVVLEIRERARVGDERDDERTAERGLAERAHADARARLVERGEVVDDLLPTRQNGGRRRARSRGWSDGVLESGRCAGSRGERRGERDGERERTEARCDCESNRCGIMTQECPERSTERTLSAGYAHPVEGGVALMGLRLLTDRFVAFTMRLQASVRLLRSCCRNSAFLANVGVAGAAVEIAMKRAAAADRDGRRRSSRVRRFRAELIALLAEAGFDGEPFETRIQIRASRRLRC